MDFLSSRAVAFYSKENGLDQRESSSCQKRKGQFYDSIWKVHSFKSGYNFETTYCSPYLLMRFAHRSAVFFQSFHLDFGTHHFWSVFCWCLKETCSPHLDPFGRWWRQRSCQSLPMRRLRLTCPDRTNLFQPQSAGQIWQSWRSSWKHCLPFYLNGPDSVKLRFLPAPSYSKRFI